MLVEITFKNRRLADLCASKDRLQRKFGEACGNKVARRIALLDAAECLADVPHTPPDRCHQLTGDRKGQFAVDAQQPYRVVFKPRNPVPLKIDGGIDLKKVTAIEILEIEDYH